MENKENINYVHIEPNSHFYTDLNHIKESVRLGLEKDYIIKGIDNTIEKGLNIRNDELNNFYLELKERLIYLNESNINNINHDKIYECNLTMLRIQQILLDRLKK